MIKTFNQLSQEEQEILFTTPAKAAILVGGADEDFNKIERKVAKELTHIKSYTSDDALKEFYAIVSNRFIRDVDSLMINYPTYAKDRNPLIRKELKAVIPVLDQLGDDFKNGFQDSVIEIARYVAEASGGVLGFLSVSHQESTALSNLTKVLKEHAY
jgi:hypothetical protein